MKTNKGRVFIVWSGEQKGKRLALEVKNQLRDQGFEGVVGGESLEGTIPIGDTIFHEIDSCHNAIILVSKREDNTLSNNLTLEWGYCHHKFKGKEESFLINETTLSDFDVVGMNSNQIPGIVDFEKDANITEVARRIVERYISLQDSRLGDVLHVIDSWAAVESDLTDKSVPDFKMAKLILFYSQSGYIFHRLSDSEKFLSSFQTNNSQTLSLETDLALQYSMVAIKMFNSFSSDAGSKTTRSFSSLEDSYLSLIKKVPNADSQTREDDDFQKWFLVSVLKNLNYLYLVKARDSKISEQDRQYYIDRCQDAGTRCIELCMDLKRNPDNKYYAILCASYMYRNLYDVYKTRDHNQSLYYATLAVDAKRDLKDYVLSNMSFSKSLKDYCELEYYVSLVESLRFCQTDSKVRGYLEELNGYCNRVERIMHRRLASLSYIRTTIKQEEKQIYFFDFDLTIADSILASKTAYDAAFSCVGAMFSSDSLNVLDLLSEHLEETYHRIQSPKRPYVDFQSAYIKAFDSRLLYLYDDVPSLFQWLHERRKRIVIFSNRDCATIESFLNENKLRSMVSYVISAENTPLRRKTAETVIRCLQREKTNPETAIYLGDSNEDRDCAQKAGLDFVRVDRYHRYGVEPGVRLVSSLIELI